MAKQIAQNGNRFYRVDMLQMRYFPIAAAKAQLMLSTGEAIEVAYLPFGRSDILQAHSAAHRAITAAQAA